MAMPPRGADLWRDARGLGLYGDGDEEEMRAMGDAARENAQSKKKFGASEEEFGALAAKGEGGRSGGAMTIEEELLLTDEARDPAEAAAKAAARIGVDVKDLLELDSQWDDEDEDGSEAFFELYSAPNPDHPGGDSPALDHHRRSLARLAAQTAAAAAYADVSGGADYAGTRPDAISGSGRNGNPTGDHRGARIDSEQDTKPLLRRGPRSAERRRERDASGATKRQGVLREARPRRGVWTRSTSSSFARDDSCRSAAESRDFFITAAGPSDALMCATRVLLANETEVKALEGGGSDPHWSGDRMESASEIERLKALGLMHEPFRGVPTAERHERTRGDSSDRLRGDEHPRRIRHHRGGRPRATRDVDPVVLGLLGYDDDRYSDRYGDSYGDGERGVWSGDSDDPIRIPRRLARFDTNATQRVPREGSRRRLGVRGGAPRPRAADAAQRGARAARSRRDVARRRRRDLSSRRKGERRRDRARRV